jgi:hypothetical protein
MQSLGLSVAVRCITDESALEALTVSGKSIAKVRQDAEIAKKEGFVDDRTLALSGEATLIRRMMSPGRPNRTDQIFLLSDLCVFANLAIDLPETVSTCAASRTLAVPPPRSDETIPAVGSSGRRLLAPRNDRCGVTNLDRVETP